MRVAVPAGAATGAAAGAAAGVGAAVLVAVRAGCIGAEGENEVPFQLEQSDYVGGGWVHHGLVAGQAFRVEGRAEAVGSVVRFHVADCLVFAAG